MAITEGFTMIQTVFQGTRFAGIEWIIPIIVVFISLIIITRDFESWGLLAFPVCLIWNVVGFRIPLIFLIGSALFFAVTVLSLQKQGMLIETGYNIMKRPFRSKKRSDKPRKASIVDIKKAFYMSDKKSKLK